MRRQDMWGLAAVLTALVGFIVFRALYIEPREWGALCVSAAPPQACLPRGALIWLQRTYLWGTLSLMFGVWGFAWRGGFPVQLLAVLFGIAAIENYNATWGAVGLALGIWAWTRRDGWYPVKE